MCLPVVSRRRRWPFSESPQRLDRTDLRTMTTAHRPTWAPAKGHEEQGGARMFGPSQKHSKLDDAAHTVLKTRCVTHSNRFPPSHAEFAPPSRGRSRPCLTRHGTFSRLTPPSSFPTKKIRNDGQATIKELMERDFRAELEERERAHFKKKLGGAGGTDAVGQLTAGDDDTDAGPRFVPKALDADDSDSDDASGSESDSDDDEDDTQALLAELERIKKDRAEETARRDAEAREAEVMERAEELATGNPLLNLGSEEPEYDFSVKRRWDDDVVFRNQTRGETKHAKRFVNDTIRSDFHRRFLNKYIK